MTEPPVHRWRALAVCLVAAFMALLDVSIVNVALPAIRAGLHASDSGLQWIITGYALTFGLVLIPAGRLGDARTRRGVFMAGLALFTLASVAAGFAQTIEWLILARLVQGVGGGVLTPQIAGLIQQLFSGAERGRAFGRLGAVIGLATAAGPLIGGALIQLAGPGEGWRWVFFVNLPVGVVALELARRLIPVSARPPGAGRPTNLDPVGVVLLGAGIATLLVPFMEARQWPGGAKWLLVPAGLALIAGFVAWERRYATTGEPLVDLSLFRKRSYAFGNALALLYFAGFTTIFFIFTLYLQNGLRYSALLAGTAITPFAIGSGAGAAISGRLVTRMGRPLITAGLLIVMLGIAGTLLAVHLVPGHAVGLATAFPLFVAGFGSGSVISPNQTLTLACVPHAKGGSAAGVLQTGQRLGTAIGIAGVGAVFFGTLTRGHGDWAVAFQYALGVVALFVLAALLISVADLLTGRERTG